MVFTFRVEKEHCLCNLKLIETFTWDNILTLSLHDLQRRKTDVMPLVVNLFEILNSYNIQSFVQKEPNV